MNTQKSNNKNTILSHTLYYSFYCSQNILLFFSHILLGVTVLSVIPLFQQLLQETTCIIGISCQCILAMANGISTRLQCEVGQHQKELERIESKLDGSVSQLRSEVEQLGTDMRRMFEQMMAKRDAGKRSVEIVEEDSRCKSSVKSSQLHSGQSMVTMATAEDTKDDNHRYC